VELITEYIEAVNEIERIHNLELADKKSVRKSNKLANRIRTIATEINRYHSEFKEEFYQLLFHENERVRIWASHHILEVMEYENVYRKNALKEIRRVAKNDKTVEGLGNKMWLQEWYSSHPKDKFLF